MGTVISACLIGAIVNALHYNALVAPFHLAPAAKLCKFIIRYCEALLL